MIVVIYLITFQHKPFIHSFEIYPSPKNLEKNNMILNRLTQICGYADDILVIARSLPALEVLCIELSREAGRVGLVVSPDKTKYMKFSASPSQRSMKGATINGVTYEGVTEFIYLGTLIGNDNSIQ
jgi:hypothetical protein